MGIWYYIEVKHVLNMFWSLEYNMWSSITSWWRKSLSNPSQLPRLYSLFTLGRGKKRHRIKERENRRKKLIESQSWVNVHTVRRRVTTRLSAERWSMISRRKVKVDPRRSLLRYFMWRLQEQRVMMIMSTFICLWLRYCRSERQR